MKNGKSKDKNPLINIFEQNEDKKEEEKEPIENENITEEDSIDKLKNEENQSVNEKEEAEVKVKKFKCSECGGLVNEHENACPHCGESFVS